MEIHIECVPDETLVSKIGFSKRQVKHHAGKSRVFGTIEKLNDQIALVDEDPGQVKHRYEKRLVFQRKKDGISYFLDPTLNNKVIVLKVKLEDWIIASCKKTKINPIAFGLPDKPNELHSVILNRLKSFNKLLDELQHVVESPIITLEKFIREI